MHQLRRLQILTRFNSYSPRFPLLCFKVIQYSALVEGLYAMGYASIHVTAGDLTLPGPFYQASAEVEEWGSSGMGDMKILSAMHLDANCIGNHELE